MKDIDEIAVKAEQILSSIVPNVACVAQEWDRRIDCVVKLPDGSTVGEMVPIDEFSENRVRETGERLRQRLAGIDVRLLDEIRTPARIVPHGD